MERRETPSLGVYGTLADPMGIDTRMERFLAPDATAAAGAWRRKQPEYGYSAVSTAVRAACERYAS